MDFAEYVEKRLNAEKIERESDVVFLKSQLETILSMLHEQAKTLEQLRSMSKESQRRIERAGEYLSGREDDY